MPKLSITVGTLEDSMSNGTSFWPYNARIAVSFSLMYEGGTNPSRGLLTRNFGRKRFERFLDLPARTPAHAIEYNSLKSASKLLSESGEEFDAVLRRSSFQSLRRMHAENSRRQIRPTTLRSTAPS
jgi:hypothetical protein